MKRTWLVTGGAGFIGANFVHHLLDHHPDDRVVVYDKLTYAGNLDNLRDRMADPRFAFVHADICDRAAVEAAVDGHGVDTIANFAAETHVDRSIMSSDRFVDTNVRGTQVLLDAARTVQVPLFVQISTDETYGSCSGEPFGEDAPLVPRNPYSATKAAADLLVRSYWVTHGVPAVVVRPSNNFGPMQFPEKFLALAITNLLDGKEVPLYGDGENIREWIFVEDTCRAIEVVLGKGEPGNVYNVGLGSGVTNRDVLNRVLALTGHGPEMIRPVPDRPGHDRRYAIATDKIRHLGWEPELDLDAGLTRTVTWYRENQDWWRPLKERAADGRLPTTPA